MQGFILTMVFIIAVVGMVCIEKDRRENFKRFGNGADIQQESKADDSESV